MCTFALVKQVNSPKRPRYLSMLSAYLQLEAPQVSAFVLLH
jgi:hypothetical protein